MNSMLPNYEVLYHSEQFGEQGYGVKIMVASTMRIDLKTDELIAAGYLAGEAVQQELQAAFLADDEAALANAKRERAELIALFDTPIYVETIPNGYCSKACCRHMPWFVVTTTVGRFKLGWRKRVISIDWSETVANVSSEDLFPQENVTKSGRLIHAWSLDDARRYIAAVIAIGSTS